MVDCQLWKGCAPHTRKIWVLRPQENTKPYYKLNCCPAGCMLVVKVGATSIHRSLYTGGNIRKNKFLRVKPFKWEIRGVSMYRILWNRVPDSIYFFHFLGGIVFKWDSIQIRTLFIFFIFWGISFLWKRCVKAHKKVRLTHNHEISALYNIS